MKPRLNLPVTYPALITLAVWNIKNIHVTGNIVVFGEHFTILFPSSTYLICFLTMS